MKESNIVDGPHEEVSTMPRNMEPGRIVSIEGKVDMVHLCSCWSCSISEIPYESRFVYEVVVEPKRKKPMRDSWMAASLECMFK